MGSKNQPKYWQGNFDCQRAKVAGGKTLTKLWNTPRANRATQCPTQVG